MKLLLTLALSLVTSATSSKCKDLSNLSVGDQCASTWKNLRPLLRPTQNSVGWAWVFRTFLKDMQSEGDAQDEMDDKIVPVALYDGVAFVVDHHHHLAALDLSGYEDVKVTLYISCDFSGMSIDELWSSLQQRAFTYLYGRAPGQPDALPTPVSHDALPAQIGFRKGNVTMVDDKWRALAGFARKIDSAPGCSNAVNHNYGCRAYDRVCTRSGQGIPFFEYRWAYFFDDAAKFNTSLWERPADSAAFLSQYTSLRSPSPDEPVKSVDDWVQAAALLVPLARGAAAGTYRLPAEMGAMQGPLPGYHSGLDPFPHDDPSCDLPSC